MFNTAVSTSLSRLVAIGGFSVLISLGCNVLADSTPAKAVQAETVQRESVAHWLARADHYRMPNSVAKSVTRVELFDNDQLSSESLYHVYSQTDRRSLVVFKSDHEKGQKMLMLQDNYWLLMPHSKRPIRITPMQKLLGQASVGDISTMTWSQDYDVEDVVEERDALQLVLKAKAGQSNYQRIELWLTVKAAFPIRANLYLKSGKLAKTAYFKADPTAQRVESMRLVDGFQPEKVTLIHYEQHDNIALEDKFYNPAYLVRQNLSDF